MNREALSDEEVVMELKQAGANEDDIKRILRYLRAHNKILVKVYQRTQVSKKQRFEIFKRDNFKCQYCGAKAPGVKLEIDHILPVSRGGGNDPGNLITACEACNMGKGGNLLAE